MIHMPSPAEIAAEIESGPLKEQLAPHWAIVYPTEPEPEDRASPAWARWDRIKSRFGSLNPDGAFGVLQVLNDPTLGRTRMMPMRISAFAQFAAERGFLTTIQSAALSDGTPSEVRNICTLLMLTIQGAADRGIDPNDPATASMIEALVKAGIATAADKEALLRTCTVPSSRIDELGWPSLSLESIISAKGARE